jgi:hypothetical protein
MQAEPPQSAGELVVKRERRHASAAQRWTVLIDGERVGRLWAGESQAFKRLPVCTASSCESAGSREARS